MNECRFCDSLNFGLNDNDTSANSENLKTTSLTQAPGLSLDSHSDTIIDTKYNIIFYSNNSINHVSGFAPYYSSSSIDIEHDSIEFITLWFERLKTAQLRAV